MSKMTISYEDFGRTITYEQEFIDSPCVDDVINSYLEAYESFGFQNDLDVIIRNGIAGDTKISWDSENYITQEDHDEHDLEQYKYQSEMYYDAWSTVWDTLCQEMPTHIWMELLGNSGSGIDTAKEAIMFLIDHYNETVNPKDSYMNDIRQSFEDALDAMEGASVKTGDFKVFLDGNDLSHLVSRLEDFEPKEKWYMGHQY